MYVQYVQNQITETGTGKRGADFKHFMLSESLLYHCIHTLKINQKLRQGGFGEKKNHYKSVYVHQYVCNKAQLMLI